uniref:Glycosyltransferase RgtA/B/C/D-like domain-containing protein n=1 Tax=Magnetococcus massalia (strain MO-1) TaxID=451514 RepID=A0A1S7LEP0_MAGMO|nr:Conserved membrane protein of unknown function [Candidatus Magnetococcus massalia]
MVNNFLSPRLLALLLPLILLGHVGYYLLAGPAFYASDDLAYAQRAYDLLTGQYQLTAHSFDNRFGAFIPVVLPYALFGVDPYTTTLWPLVCSLILITLVYRIATRVWDQATGLLAALLLAFNPWQINASTILGVDLMMSLLLFLVAWAIYHARRAEGMMQRRVWLLVAALLLLSTMFTRLNFIWIFPFLAVVMGHDLLKRQHHRFWLEAVVVALLTLVAYFGFYEVVAGDALLRIHFLEGILEQQRQMGDHVARQYYILEGWQAYAKRLSYEPILLIMSRPGLLIVTLLALPLLWLWRPMQGWVKPGGMRLAGYWLLYGMMMLGIYWFGTRSFSAYNLMDLKARYLLPILPPLALLAAMALRRLLQLGALGVGVSWRQVTLALLVWLGLLFGLKSLGYEKVQLLLVGAPLLFWLGLLAWRGREPLSRLQQGIALSGLLLGLSIAPLFSIANGAIGPLFFETSERTVVAKHLSEPSQPTLLLTDQRSSEALPYRLGFNPPAALTIQAWRHLKGQPFPRSDRARRVLVLVHGFRLGKINPKDPTHYPPEVINPPAHWSLLHEAQGVQLFEIKGERP